MSNQGPFDQDAGLDKAQDFFTGEPVPDEYQDLVNSAEQEVHGWLPKPGQTLFGTVMDISEAESEYGTYPLLIVRRPSGMLVGAHCFHTVLKREIQRKLNDGRLDIGDDIAIHYIGEGVASQGRNAPNMYRVTVRPRK